MDNTITLIRPVKVRVIAIRAAQKFDRKQTIYLFNTAGFHQELEKELGLPVYSNEVRDLLLRCEDVVRLSGGEHWFLLPYPLEKYE